MFDTNTKVAMLRECSKVERCHTNPHHGSYTNGQHSFDMLTLAAELMPDVTRNVLLAIMYHDFPERWTGDTPSPAKDGDPAFAKGIADREDHIERIMGWKVELTHDELMWVKALDKLELFLWSKDQLAMGNMAVQFMADALFERLTKTSIPQPIVDLVMDYQWVRTSNNFPV